MGLADRRKVIKTGKYSKAITIPAKLKVGRTVTLAANRILIVDLRGEISEDQLLDFLEQHVEPKFWSCFAAFLRKKEGEKPELSRKK